MYYLCTKKESAQAAHNRDKLVAMKQYIYFCCTIAVLAIVNELLNSPRVFVTRNKALCDQSSTSRIINKLKIAQLQQRRDCFEIGL